MFNVTLLKQAGIGPGVAAKLLDVSRVTASQWYNGRVNPHTLLKDRVATFMSTVQAALDQKLLPLASYPGRKNLHAAISAALDAAKQTQTS